MRRSRSRAAPPDVLSIEGLMVDCVVGVHPHERSVPQPLRVDVELALDTSKAGETQRLRMTVDYAQIASQIAFVLQSCRFHLLETAAHALTRYLLAPPALGEDRPRLQEVRLRLVKPRALGGLGVPSLEVWRSAAEVKLALETKAFGTVDVVHETKSEGIYRLNVAPGRSIGLHVHRVMSESEMILGDGLLLNGARAAPGSVYRWPHGTPHRYDNPTDRWQSILCVDSPPFLPDDEIAVEGEAPAVLPEAPFLPAGGEPVPAAPAPSRAEPDAGPRITPGAPARVLVTGASRGIGRAVIDALAGRRLAGVARERGSIPAGVHAIGADLGRAEAAEAVIDEASAALSGLDGLVHAAGFADHRALRELEAEHVDAAYAIHARAALLLARRFAARLGERQGSIVLVASTLALEGVPGTAAYAAAKGAVMALTRTLAAELAPRVRVNCVVPGPIATEMLGARAAELGPLIPLGRAGTADEVARTIVHLLDAGFATGSVVVLDGGMTAVGR